MNKDAMMCFNTIFYTFAVLTECQKTWLLVMDYTYLVLGYVTEILKQCDDHGNYKRKLCVINRCICVVPETGKYIPGLLYVSEQHNCKGTYEHS